MQVNIPAPQAARVNVPVRIAIRDADIRRLRGEHMNSSLEYIDSVVQLGASDFENDDQRLFALDFAATLASESGASWYGPGKLVPARLVLGDMPYPIDGASVEKAVIGFLKAGVDEGRRRDARMAELKAMLVGALQMVGPVVTRFAASKRELVARCDDWSSRLEACTQAEDEATFQALLQEREALVQELPEDSLELAEELTAFIEGALVDALPDFTWKCVGLGGFDITDDYSKVERVLGPLQSKIHAEVCMTGSRRASIQIKFEASVASPLFRRWSHSETVDLREAQGVMKAFDQVLDGVVDSQRVFDAAAARRKQETEAAEREHWIAENGSVELRAALRHGLPVLGLYVRERLAAAAAAAGADLSDFLMDVDSFKFWVSHLDRHADPSTAALKLIASLGAVIEKISVGRVSSDECKLKVQNQEVVVVRGSSVAPDCPDVYLWRPLIAPNRAVGRSRARQS